VRATDGYARVAGVTGITMFSLWFTKWTDIPLPLAFTYTASFRSVGSHPRPPQGHDFEHTLPLDSARGGGPLRDAHMPPG
jgi:hypothetical protein